MTQKKHYLIDRLADFRRVFNAIFSRTATVKHAIPKMNQSIAEIISAAKVLEAGMGHITEAYFDSQQLSDKFAHLVTFAINLPSTIEGDDGYWGYAVSLVDTGTFRKGIESVDLEKLQELDKALQEVIAIKLQLKSERENLP